MLAASAAQATEFARTRALFHFELQESPLADALLKYSELTGIGLVFDSRLVENLKAPALSGDYVARTALKHLLEGTGLRAERISADILTIVPVRVVPAPDVADAGVDVDDVAAPQAASVEAPIDELLIIGTRTANPPYFKFIPAATLEGQTIQFGGSVNVADELFQMPAMLSDITSANTTIFGTPAGLNLADLRGLGSQRTLVLVNGRRFTPTFGGNLSLYGVDLNSISASLIDRVEVLTGGAAATYGGDAVSGVVNFVMRDKVEGFSTAVQGGITGKGDHEEFLASVTYGADFAAGRGNIIASLSVDRQAGLYMTDRHVTSDPSGFALDGHPADYTSGTFTRGYGRSGLTPMGAIGTYVRDDGKIAYLNDYYQFSEDGTALHPFTGHKNQRYAYAPDHTLMTPINRVFGTLGARYELAPGHRLVWESSFSDNRVESQLAPLPFTGSTGTVTTGAGLIAVPLSNPYVPDVLRDKLPADARALLVDRRAVELGPRKTDIRRTNLRTMLGLQGKLSHDWTYDAYYQYGRNSVREERDGLMDLINYRAALDPALCAEMEGCSVINPFGVGHISAEQAAFYRAPNAVRKIHATQHILSAVASGPIDLGRRLEATLSVGAEYRRESLSDQPDPTLANRPVAGSLTYPGASGAFDVAEVFTDATLPLLRDLPLVKEFTLTAGVRASDFSTVGAVGIWHVGGYWEPVTGFTFRVSYQDGRRAPNIAELYAGGPSVYESVYDPCSDPASSTVAANCASDGPLGVPSGYVQSAYLVEVQSYGNPDLDAEKASNLTAGFTIESARIWPSIPGNMRLSFDAYRIKVHDYVVGVDADQLLGACYDSANLSSGYCGINPATGDPYVQRNPGTGELTIVSGSIINAGNLWFEGYDIDLQYVLDARALSASLPFDYFSLTGRYSRNTNAEIQPITDGEVYQALGEAKYPKHRFQVSASFSRGDVTLDWDMRYRGTAYSSNEIREVPDARIPAVWYHDASMRWEWEEGRILYAGVRNIFDRKAPRVAYGSVGDTLPEYYDVLGRRFFLGAVIDF